MQQITLSGWSAVVEIKVVAAWQGASPEVLVIAAERWAESVGIPAAWSVGTEVEGDVDVGTVDVASSARAATGESPLVPGRSHMLLLRYLILWFRADPVLDVEILGMHSSLASAGISWVCGPACPRASLHPESVVMRISEFTRAEGRSLQNGAPGRYSSNNRQATSKNLLSVPGTLAPLQSGAWPAIALALSYLLRALTLVAVVRIQVRRNLSAAGS